MFKISQCACVNDIQVVLWYTKIVNESMAGGINDVEVGGGGREPSHLPPALPRVQRNPVSCKAIVINSLVTHRIYFICHVPLIYSLILYSNKYI